MLDSNLYRALAAVTALRRATHRAREVAFILRMTGLGLVTVAEMYLEDLRRWGRR